MVSIAEQFGSSEVLTEKRKPRCVPRKLHPIKNGFLGKDFPSKVRVVSQSSGLHGEDFDQDESLSDESPKPFEFDKPPISFWRIADCHDIDHILDLIEMTDHMVDELFSPPDIADLIEKSALALVQFNAKKEMVSFTVVLTYPNIPAVPSFEWYAWMERMYEIDGISPRNCFFIHYMIWRPDYYEDFMALTLETLFMEFPFLKYIVLIRPPLVKIPELFTNYFIPVLPKESHRRKWESNSLQIFLLCLRHSLLDRLKIRLAIVEDHDDLMPIIEHQTKKLRELYGDFCMAEIIEYPGTEDRKTLVCEVSGYVTAFMSLNKAVDLDLLNSQFDLGVFHGLRKPNENDKGAEIIGDGQEKIVYLPEKVSPSLDVINSDTMQTILNWKPTRCESEEDSQTEKSDESEDSNGLPTSMVELIKESLETKIIPKSSAAALLSTDSASQKSEYNSEYGEGRYSIRTELSLISLQYYNLPEYHGPPNAFCIQLFASHENFDEKLCADFLEAAFELFPELDYCLMTIPSQCITFPLLDLFVRVTPRPLKRFKQELYVCHRSSVMITFMRVRRVLKSDLKEIYNLLRGIKNREFIYADVATSCTFPDSAYQGFVLICNKLIVGVAVLCNEHGLEYITERYHVESLIDFNLHKIDYHAVLKHMVLSPIYQTHARFFLRDVMRMADITALYRARYEEAKTQWNTSSLITALGQFVPVKPRRMLKYHEPSLGRNLPPPYLLEDDVPFALYHINSRICTLQKFTCNINLVVVGTSRTAFSFLENLLYAPNSAYVMYNNITWVSPHGTGAELAPHPARDLMFPGRGKYDRRYKAQISLQTYVNVVYGVMTGINRTEKYITINNDAILRYDYLVLLCGKQYIMPVPLVRELDITKCRRGARPRCSLFKYLVTQKEYSTHEEASAQPKNVFLVNTMVDATNAIISLQYMLKKRNSAKTSEKIIVYGQDVIAYLCIQSFLKFGISPETIVLVEPPAKDFCSEKVFMDPNVNIKVSPFRAALKVLKVDYAVTNILHDLKIKHYRDYILYDWAFCDNEQLYSVTFHSNHSKVTLRCLALFPFEEKLVSEATFKAVNEASLVYDGRLVINHRFQTNDPYIYSAGPLTKYQRKYYANDKSHEYFNSTEVGKLLAEVIRGEIDPTEEGYEEDPENEEDVPVMSKPIVLYGVLPGDWNYFHLRKPGKIVPMEAECNIKEYGETLITGDCQMTNGYGYFRLHLDDFGIVRTIVCFTKDEIDAQNLYMLYGKHEKYLNNLLLRFNLGLITDFFAYFRQPWVYALYHDRFKFLMKANRELFTQEKYNGEQSLGDTIEEALKESSWFTPDECKLSEIVEKYEASSVKDGITKNLVKYLTTFDVAFPMYATSGIVRVLLDSASTSLLHKSLFRERSGVEYKPSIKISNIEYNF